MYCLALKYNEAAPVLFHSAELAGLSAHLYTATSGALCLCVSVEVAGQRQDHWLDAVIPGDSLVFSYQVSGGVPGISDGDLSLLSRPEKTHPLADGFRYGLDVEFDSGAVRISHPVGGGFSFRLANVPRDHARAFVMAGNAEESWNWQFKDLNPGHSISLRVVETDWNDPPPRISRKQAAGDA